MLRTYRLLKSDYGKEHYVDLNLKRNERSVLAQLRCGILPLRIETGRYIGEPPNQRLCNQCDSRTVEDECHFVMECNFYNDIRSSFFADLVNIDDFNNIDKLVYIVRQHPRRLAKFLLAAVARRRSRLYHSI